MQLKEVKKGTAGLMIWLGLFIALASIAGAAIWDLLCWSLGRRRVVVERYQDCYVSERQPYGYNPKRNRDLPFSQALACDDDTVQLEYTPPLLYLVVFPAVFVLLVSGHIAAAVALAVAMVLYIAISLIGTLRRADAPIRNRNTT